MSCACDLGLIGPGVLTLGRLNPSLRFWHAYEFSLHARNILTYHPGGLPHTATPSPPKDKVFFYCHKKNTLGKTACGAVPISDGPTCETPETTFSSEILYAISNPHRNIHALLQLFSPPKPHEYYGQSPENIKLSRKSCTVALARCRQTRCRYS